MKSLPPTPVPWKPTDALIVFILSWVGVPLALIFAAGQLAPYLPLAGSWLAAFKAGDIWASFGFALVDAVAALAIVGLYLQKYQASWRDAGWRKFNWVKALIYGLAALVLLAVAVQVAFVIVSVLFPAFNAAQPQNNEFTGAATPGAKRLALLALVVLPPIVEETVFRGFIFPALSKWGGALVGAILTSALFGLAHLQYNVSVYTWVLSLILCYMYWRLRSIWPGIFLHMVNNYIAYLAIIKK